MFDAFRTLVLVAFTIVGLVFDTISAIVMVALCVVVAPFVVIGMVLKAIVKEKP